ncbi:MAG: OsmC family protein [Candidatus Bipolaricaulota bacterium]|nr:OsmC family protein [Candidatus Bipolaricaulota bacterium]
MEMRIDFPGGKRVDAAYKGFVIRTDQPQASGGANSAPSPFDLFLASLGTCSGYYVLTFLERRGIPATGVSLALSATWDETAHRVGKVEIRICLPKGFPDEYVEASVRAAGQCAVKAHLESSPSVSIVAERA